MHKIQSNFLIYGDYLGQTPPTDTPVIFAPGIISKITLEHSAAIFSSSRERKYVDLYICFHDINNDKWSEPLKLGDAINTSTQETFPFVSPDGKYLFFTRWTDEKNDMDVYWVSSSFIDSLKEKHLEKQ
jgi:WD40-like Beta Propeller Repeat